MDLSARGATAPNTGLLPMAAENVKIAIEQYQLPQIQFLSAPEFH